MKAAASWHELSLALLVSLASINAGCTNSFQPVPARHVVTAPAPAPPYNALFQPIVKKLKESESLPLLLPKELPSTAAGAPLYALLTRSNGDGYTITLSHQQQCEGSADCRLATFSADRINHRRRRLRGQVVRLTPAITGYVDENNCRKGCPDSTIKWQQQNLIYTIALPGGKLTELIGLARSAIENGPQ